MVLIHSQENYCSGPDTTDLNTVDIWIDSEVSQELPWIPGGQYWVIYIHGGAWRDPSVDSKSFEPALSILHESSTEIAGYASINYRLSPYASHPEIPSSPDDPARNAKDPDHANDVWAALLFLESKYSIHQRYILVGHGCGAFLAFQVGSQDQTLDAPTPHCVLGIEGIYHLPAMLECHGNAPVYRHFVENAFSKDEKTWESVSPAVAPMGIWRDNLFIIISHSKDDELVEMNQARLMFERMEAQDELFKFILVKGAHDEIWREGKEVARVILETLSILREKYVFIYLKNGGVERPPWEDS